MDLYRTLPDIKGTEWRALRLQDGEALADLEVACKSIDGETALRDGAAWQREIGELENAKRDSVVAMGKNGRVAAVGHISYSDRAEEVHAFLEGRIHPGIRGKGVGIRLLAWLEHQAVKRLDEVANGRSRILRILFFDRGPDAIALFEEAGYRFQYAEDEMTFSLKQKLPEQFMLSGLMAEDWSPSNAAGFYEAYSGAFQTRTDQLLSRTAWTSHFADPTDEEFRRDFSLLMRYEEDEQVGFVVCHVDDPDGRDGWGTQIGGVPEWRRRGVG